MLSSTEEIDWELVRFVDVVVDLYPTCAICLDEALVPHTLECGHIFCLPCILLHFSMSSNCCVCNEFSKADDLRSVRVQIVSPCLIGTNRTFQLVVIENGISKPVINCDENQLPDLRSIGWWFSRLVLISQEDVIQCHQAELHQLISLSAHHSDSDSIHSFGHTLAIEFLSCRLGALGLIIASNPSTGNGNSLVLPLDELTKANELTNTHHSDDPPNGVYAYQLSDGQHVYLDPLWARVLLLNCTGNEHSKWSEGFSTLPKSITVPVIHTVAHTLTEENLSRFKFLSHLPIGSAFTLCDVDLRAEVSLETLHAMAPAISRRIQQIKNYKTQIRRDKIDKRNQARIPLSREWDEDIAAKHHLMNPSIAPQTMPSQADFTPLVENAVIPSVSSFVGRTTYAQLAAELGNNGGFINGYTSNPAVPAPIHYATGEELTQAVNDFAKRLSLPGNKKKPVKLRIAG